jgi:apolipoprotein N-acyltransferase
LLPAIVGTICISLAVAIAFQFSVESLWWPIASFFSLIWGGLATAILVTIAVALRKREDRIARERFEARAVEGNVPEAIKLLDKLGYDSDK